MLKKLSILLFVALAIPIGGTDEAQAFMMGGGASSSTCSYTPPLDANPAAAAYSFRVLASNWLGQNIVTIKRSSDSTSKTFSASAPGCGINTADAFFDGSTYTVVTWYDQSGHGADVTQATVANQPSVTLSCQNGHPCGVYNGTTTTLAGTLASTVGADTFAAVAMFNSTSASRDIVVIGDNLGTAGTGLQYSVTGSACASTRSVSGSPARGTKTCSTSTWYRWIGTQNATLSSIYLNGTQGTDNTTSLTLTASTEMHIGKDGNGNAGGFYSGDISEVIVFAPDLSISNSNTVSSNQGSYWGL